MVNLMHWLIYDNAFTFTFTTQKSTQKKHHIILEFFCTIARLKKKTKEHFEQHRSKHSIYNYLIKATSANIDHSRSNV